MKWAEKLFSFFDKIWIYEYGHNKSLDKELDLAENKSTLVSERQSGGYISDADIVSMGSDVKVMRNQTGQEKWMATE